MRRLRIRAPSKLRLTMEDIADGKVHDELEHVFYCKISNFTQLNHAAAVEAQEQWEYKIEKSEKNAGSARMRSRKTTVRGEQPFYTKTVKTKVGVGEKEITEPTTVDSFDQFKVICESGMIKHRYHFPVVDSNLVFEVDMFLKPATETGGRVEYYQWCKVDLEVANLSDPIPSLPIQVDEFIHDIGKDLPQDKRALITSLYDQYFLSKNQFLGT